MLIKILTVTLLLCTGTISFLLSKMDSSLGKLDPQKNALSIGERSKKMEEVLIQKKIEVPSFIQKEDAKIYSELLKATDSFAMKASLEEAKEKDASLRANLKNSGIVSKAKQNSPRLDSFFTCKWQRWQGKRCFIENTITMG